MWLVLGALFSTTLSAAGRGTELSLGRPENHVPAGEWLERGIAQGWVPDEVLSVGQCQGQCSVDAVLRQRPPVFRIPAHDYELMHEGGGNRPAPWFTGPGRQAFDRHQAMPLFWGESFHLTRAQLDAAGP